MFGGVSNECQSYIQKREVEGFEVKITGVKGKARDFA